MEILHSLSSLLPPKPTPLITLIPLCTKTKPTPYSILNPLPTKFSPHFPLLRNHFPLPPLHSPLATIHFLIPLCPLPTPSLHPSPCPPDLGLATIFTSSPQPDLHVHCPHISLSATLGPHNNCHELTTTRSPCPLSSHLLVSRTWASQQLSRAHNNQISMSIVLTSLR